MPRIKTSLNPVNEKKVNNFLSRLVNKYPELDTKKYRDSFIQKIKHELKYLHDFPQNEIISILLTYCDDYFLVFGREDLTTLWKEIIIKTRNHLIRNLESKSYDNIIDKYFDDVKKEYILHPMDESSTMEFCEENKDVFIKNNLKLVVSVAKKYRGMGLPFEELIQCGNEGLMKAFDKFDANRSSLRTSIIKDISENIQESFTYDDVVTILSRNYRYCNITEESNNKIPGNGFPSKESFISWVKKNVKTAVFASVAFMWIRAYILQGLDQSLVVKFPKPKDDDISAKSSIIYLDSINPYTEDNYNDDDLAPITEEEFIRENEDLINEERDELYKDVLNRAFYGLSPLDKRIIKKHFGIGFPYSLTIPEIAENEKMMQQDVKESIERSMEHIKSTITPETKEMILEMMT